MSSRTLLKRPAGIIAVIAAENLNRRLISNAKSNPHRLCSTSAGVSVRGFRCNHNESERGSSVFEIFLRSIFSGAFVVGSSLGLYYGYGVSNVSFADSGNREEEEAENQSKFMFKDAYRRKVFFKYEKRLRLQSPPEKVFEYFASFQSPSGKVFMTPPDLMRAVVPVFPPSDASSVRGGFLKGEKTPGELFCSPSKFFMLFDTNNDGLISFAEYIFFVTLLSIPESSFSVAFKMFDLDNDGGIDREEFQKVMSLMRTYNRQGASHRNGQRLGLKVSGNVEEGGLLEYFFGKDGKGRLEREKFVQFLRDLHDEILRLEFEHYDRKSQGTISSRDFALSMVASADISHINKFLDRVDELQNEPNLKDVRFSLEEFKHLAELRKQLQPFSLAVFGFGKVNGLLTKKDFQRAAHQVCEIPLSDNVVELVYYIFDSDRDGNLSSEEFLRVLERREMNNMQQKGGFLRLLSC